MRSFWLPFGALYCGLLSPSAIAAPDTLALACAELAGGRGATSRACEKHAKAYELQPSLVRACAHFDPEVENRLRCLKTGADADIFALCRSTGWSRDAQLTCLRSYPTRTVLKFCLQRETEEEQLHCVREGRDR